ncbi:hypothetical protein QOZ80_6BG0493700 [Eleusine coracana subsp. coracana]|nr:hypothetical protein QOZ80_6BG0493700 [Eleusine coracana subsp. coracana]
MERLHRRRRRRRQMESCDGSIASRAATKRSPSEQDNISQADNERDDNSQADRERMKYSGPIFSEDILHHIHSLLPLRDAAQAACVSQAFLNFWRSRPSLHFSIEALEHSHKLTQFSLGEASQVKKLEMCGLSVAYYSRAKLPPIVPNLETITINSICEMASIPIVPSRFCHLKYLNIRVPRVALHQAYDYFSFASFLDASPSLDYFALRIHVPECRVDHGLFSGDPSHLRQMPEHRHDNLNCVKIIGFFPAKSLLELACYVLKRATSLECLTLATTSCCSCWQPDSDPSKRFLLAIRKYSGGDGSGHGQVGR